MNNLKANATLNIVAITLLLSCTPISAANLKTSPIPTIKSNSMSHQEILTQLLKAEMALQRDMPAEALEYFMQVARATNDPEIAQMATEIAIQLKDTNKALSASELWANSDAKSLQAQLVAVTLFSNSDISKTTQYLNRVFETKAPDIDQHLLLIVSQLSPASQKTLTDAVLKVADQRPQDPYAQLAAAQLTAVQLNVDAANNRLNAALKLKPDLTNGIELKAKLIRFEKDDDKPALAYLEEAVNKYPKDSELRMFYTTALIDNQQITKAIPNLELLSKDPVFGGDALLALGEIYIDANKYQPAEKSIKQALKFENSSDKANFYLGQLAEFHKNNSQAISYYENVSENSEYHIPAFLRAAYLYSLAGDYPKALSTLQNSSPATFADQKQILLTEIDILIDAKEYDQALDNSNQALAVLDDDLDFLYARSVVYTLMNKSGAAEKDLRTILANDPNNANALNALSFTLANQPARMNEALPLIQKAISLNPDNPAFMDTMGWLLYKMGKNQEAIEVLTEAYKISGDNEIAAHLGEVLWISGKTEEARRLWQKALQASPDNQQAINDTINRLKVPSTDAPKATSKK